MRSEARFSVLRTLAMGRPEWLPALPRIAARRGEPKVLGDVLPVLFRLGFPHLRFADPKGQDGPEAAQAIFDEGFLPTSLLRAPGTWARFARAYAGQVFELSSSPKRQPLTPEGKEALARGAPIEREEMRALVRRFMTRPGAPRSRAWTWDFVYALELSAGPVAVADAIVEVLETPPKGPVAPQLKPLIDDVGVALGMLRLRLSAAERRALDARLEALLAKPKRPYPVPRVPLTAFLSPGRPPVGSLGAPVDFLHATDGRAIAEAIASIDLRHDATYLPDLRLVFLGGEPALASVLSRFPDYARRLHPNVAGPNLGALVDGAALFASPLVDTWLEKLIDHRLVGEDARAWLRARA